MKKIYLALATILSIGVLTRCVTPTEKEFKKTDPDPSYTFYTQSDTTKLNPDSIKVNDPVFFKLKSSYSKLRSFILYTGQSQCEYKTSYNMKDSAQDRRNVGLTVVKNGSNEYVSDGIIYSTPGLYKIYMVSSVINTLTGETKDKIDSSKTIKVYDPNAILAKLFTFQMTLPNSIPTTIDEQNHVIQFLNLSPADTNLLKKCRVGYTATSTKVYVDGTLITTTQNYKITVNSKIKVAATLGAASQEYSVIIKTAISSDSTIKTATVKQVGTDYPFTGKAIISGKTITIPSWPTGTTQCILTVGTTGVKAKEYTITKAQMNAAGGFKITSTAQDGKAIMEYTVVAPSAELDATIASVTLTKNKDSFIMKEVTGGYAFYVSNALDLDNSALKIVTRALLIDYLHM